LCLLPDCIFLLMLLFYIHRYILNECYNCTSSIRTGSIYNSDLSFLAFLSYCVVWWTTNWWTLCIFSDFVNQFLCLIYTWWRLHVFYNWMVLFDLDRRSMRVIGRATSISMNLYIFLWISIFYLYMIYVLHVYFNNTSLIWTGEGYQYDQFLILIYGQIMM
jgi:hypothetical protein